MAAPPRIAFPYDYGRAQAIIAGFVSEWRADDFDAVVAIARGGLVPGVMVSTALSIPLHALSYDRHQRRVDWFTTERPPAGARILLVEDIAGRGTTFSDCVQFLEEAGFQIQTFTLAYDAESRVRPDYSVPVPAGCRAWFPWERESITPAFGATRNQPQRREHEYASWATDLDGILLADLPEHLYAQALNDALARRDGLAPHEVLPEVDLSEITIITGRPEQDRQRTKAWLERHGFHGPLIMRDESRHGPEDTAIHKAETILARCHTHYIESDPVQALDIANLVKLATILWWNTSRVLIVHASETTQIRMT